MDNVCNRCLFSIPSKVEMAEEQEYEKRRNANEREKNVQTNLLNLEQIDWQPNLSIKDKK